MKLHLGVLDAPYSDGKETTGDVAETLERKYHVMELFTEHMGADVISKAFEESAKDALEDLLAGAPHPSLSLTLDATQEIETEFRKFIDRRSLDYIVPGVPTAASLMGVNKRLKSQRSNSSRPSFKDTGLYEASFKAWTD